MRKPLILSSVAIVLICLLLAFIGQGQDHLGQGSVPSPQPQASEDTPRVLAPHVARTPVPPNAPSLAEVPTIAPIDTLVSKGPDAPGMGVRGTVLTLAGARLPNAGIAASSSPLEPLTWSDSSGGFA